MATQVQFRRGTSTENNAFTGALGEITVDTTNDAIRIHDGSTAGGFETVARQAKYADIAERYHADSGDYAPGDVLVFGGENEVTISNSMLDKRIAGVVSTEPYAIMNHPHRHPELTDSSHPALALVGRVPCEVVGEINKGDLMVSSATPGHACAWTEEGSPPAGSIIGKAIENKTGTGEGVIEVLIGVR